MLITKTARWITEAALALGATAMLTGCASQGATVAKSGVTAQTVPGNTAPAPLPACYVQAAAQGDRFRSEAYYRLMLGDGLRLVPPQKLFQRLTVAAEAGENYKALYLARILTDVVPDNAGAWENRAHLAGALGLTDEQQAAQQRAATPSARTVVQPEFLPGRIVPSRPVSLEDWAGAMNLMADDVATREGRGAVIAVKDDISGVSRLAEADGTPYTIAAPIHLDDILQNAFVLRDVHAMKEHNTNGGAFAAGMLLSALAGVNSGLGNAAAAQQDSEAAAGAMAESQKIASHYKGGGFTSRTFPNGQARDTAEKPQPAGARQAIDTPAALLWLSGGSMSPAVAMRAASSSGGNAKAYAWNFQKSKENRVRISDLFYPRLSVLCLESGNCSAPLSLMEVMLGPADLETFFDGSAEFDGILRASLDLRSWRLQYSDDSSMLKVTDRNGGSNWPLIGYQPNGTCLGVRTGPDVWLAPIPGTATALAVSR